ncbi:hypothetical protein AMTRI_Chr01g131420 [Amborella trichopoda]
MHLQSQLSRNKEKLWSPISLRGLSFIIGGELHNGKVLSLKFRASFDILTGFYCYFKGNRRTHHVSCGINFSSYNEAKIKRRIRKGLNSDGVIEVLRSYSDPFEALVFFKSIAQQPKIIHITETCNYMLDILRINGKVIEMSMVCDLIQQQIIQRNQETYLTIFKGLDIFGGIKRASVALEMMSHAGFVLNVFSYKWREAMEVYRCMVAENIKPSLKTYSALMLAFGKTKDINTVMYLLHEMEALGLRPNIYTYTIRIRIFGRYVITFIVLLDFLCSCGRLADAKKLFYQMKSGNHRSDRVTYITLIDLFGDLMTMAPMWFSFTLLINALFKAERVGEALKMLDVMEKKGISANPHTYNTLILEHLKVDRLGEAQELFEFMGLHGPQPTVYTYILFIDYFGKSGDLQKALEIFGRMKNKGIVSNVVACNVCLHNLAELGRLGEAKDVFRELKLRKVDEVVKLLHQIMENGCDSDEIRINTLIGVLYGVDRLARLGKEGKIEKAMEFFKGMDQRGGPPDTVSYNTIMDSLCKDGKLGLALNMFYEMPEKGCNPNVSTYNTVIHGLVKEEKLDEALCAMVLSLDLITLNAILPMIVKHGQIKNGLRIVMDFNSKEGDQLVSSSWKTLMERILKEANLHCCYESLLMISQCNCSSID